MYQHQPLELASLRQLSRHGIEDEIKKNTNNSYINRNGLTLFKYYHIALIVEERGTIKQTISIQMAEMIAGLRWNALKPQEEDLWARLTEELLGADVATEKRNIHKKTIQSMELNDGRLIDHPLPTPLDNPDGSWRPGSQNSSRDRISYSTPSSARTSATSIAESDTKPVEVKKQEQIKSAAEKKTRPSKFTIPSLPVLRLLHANPAAPIIAETVIPSIMHSITQRMDDNDDMKLTGRYCGVRINYDPAAEDVTSIRARLRVARVRPIRPTMAPAGTFKSLLEMEAALRPLVYWNADTWAFEEVSPRKLAKESNASSHSGSYDSCFTFMAAKLERLRPVTFARKDHVISEILHELRKKFRIMVRRCGIAFMIASADIEIEHFSLLHGKRSQRTSEVSDGKRQDD